MPHKLSCSWPLNPQSMKALKPPLHYWGFFSNLDHKLGVVLRRKSMTAEMSLHSFFPYFFVSAPTCVASVISSAVSMLRMKSAFRVYFRIFTNFRERKIS